MREKIMTIEELRNSDFVKMKKREAKRHAVFASIVALLIICTILFCLKPISFDNKLFTKGDLFILYTEPIFEVATDNGESYSKADFKTKQFNFTRESPEFQQVEKVLGKYSYHLCLRSFIDMGTSKNYSHNYAVFFGENYLFISDIPYISINNKVYRIGYWGSSRISELDNELKDILKIK